MLSPSPTLIKSRFFPRFTDKLTRAPGGFKHTTVIPFFPRTEVLVPGRFFTKFLPSVLSPENVGEPRSFCLASQDRSFEYFLPVDDLQGP